MQTLFHVKDLLHWIIAHDSNKCPTKIINLLKRYPEISYTVLIAPTPEVLKVISLLLIIRAVKIS